MAFMQAAHFFRLAPQAFMKFNSDSSLQPIRDALLPVQIEDGSDAVQREGQRAAAVLVPLVKRAGEWQVILTQRPQTMPQHAGQISFPGGKRENDEPVKMTALRETQEEIGVGADDVEIIGRLPSFNAVSQYRITPFVGIVSPQAVIAPDAREVEDVFEVPLDFFMSADNHVLREVMYNGKNHRLFDMPYDAPDGRHRNVWGITAMMLYRLYQRSYLGVFEVDY